MPMSPCLTPARAVLPSSYLFLPIRSIVSFPRRARKITFWGLTVNNKSTIKSPCLRQRRKKLIQLFLNFLLLDIHWASKGVNNSARDDHGPPSTGYSCACIALQQKTRYAVRLRSPRWLPHTQPPSQR